MDTLIKADLFFFITTITVIVIATLIIIALVYVVRILRDFKDLSGHVKEEGDRIINNVGKARKSFFNIFKSKKK